jgi:hypothetical protein
MLFAQAMTVRLNIEHRLHRVAEARAVGFDLGLFKRRAIDVFEGRYELTPLGGNQCAANAVALYRGDRTSPAAAPCRRQHRRSPEPGATAKRWPRRSPAAAADRHRYRLAVSTTLP